MVQASVSVSVNVVVVVAMVIAGLRAAAFEIDEIGDQTDVRLWITINAEEHHVELFWENAIFFWNDFMVLTTEQARKFSPIVVSGKKSWMPDNGALFAVFDLEEINSSRRTVWHFDYLASRGVTLNTTCYEYWANLIYTDGTILASACIRAYPRWMQDLRPVIGHLRMRDIFIPGTHNSGSYRSDNHPLNCKKFENKRAWVLEDDIRARLGPVHVSGIFEPSVTHPGVYFTEKDFLNCKKRANMPDYTQDDDIRGQLIHGVRYLDISLGYYENTSERLFINRGPIKQRPLLHVIQEVKGFVLQTYEIVIFDLQSFPVGFDNTRDRAAYQMLANLLESQFGKLIARPPLSWKSTLNDIWTAGQSVIVTSSEKKLLDQFPNIFFGSIEQRWDDTPTWQSLESHLLKASSEWSMRSSTEPVADMAIQTPVRRNDSVTIIGGSRKVADETNRLVSKLYCSSLGEYANIVVVDFIRGTTLIESAIRHNKRRFNHPPDIKKNL